MRLVFDIETDGLYWQATQIHSITMIDVDSGQRYSATDHPYQSGKAKVVSIATALKMLAEADEVIGHNIIGFDNPVIKKLVPSWKPGSAVTDTMVLSALIYSDLFDYDTRNRQCLSAMPGRLLGSHGLEAWGYRVGSNKGDFGKTTDWSEWSEEMQQYCENDSEVTLLVWERMQTHKYSPEAIQLEHDVATIISRQNLYGFPLDEQVCVDLYAELAARRSELVTELKKVFGFWFRGLGETMPKVNNKKRGVTAGVPYTKIKLIEFNPTSRTHIAERLTTLYGWSPAQLTASGQPKIDDEVLGKLQYPESKMLSELFLIEKRIGQVAEGEQAWLKLARNGRIHGSVRTNGAVTGRMTHSNPNVAQVPGAKAPYGKPCRKAFHAGIGRLQVGCDAQGLELRCLGHYMGRYDGGAYALIILEGDIHSANQTAAQLDTRDQAKTFIYAFLYGAGDFKIGSITGATEEEISRLLSKSSPTALAKIKAKLQKDGLPVTKENAAKVLKGRKLKEEFLKKTPALKNLIDVLKVTVSERGFLKGLDGRELKIRSAHAALNTLLQSAGAVVMKKALVILDQTLQAAGHTPGDDYEFLANVHDEWQISVRNDPTFAEYVGQTAALAITQAGEHFGFRCRLDGAFKIGQNWLDTH